MTQASEHLLLCHTLLEGLETEHARDSLLFIDPLETSSYSTRTNFVGEQPSTVSMNNMDMDNSLKAAFLGSIFPMIVFRSDGRLDLFVKYVHTSIVKDTSSPRSLSYGKTTMLIEDCL